MSGRTDWLKDAQWGVFFHYLAQPASSRERSPLTAEQWNEQVDAFNVPGFVDQIAATGANYVGITIGQNSGHFCAPNATYDAIVGIRPSKCSRRDLIAELAAPLRERGLRLLAYLPSNAPCNDPQAVERLQWRWGFEGAPPGEHSAQRTGERLAAFQRQWEAVVREWGERWGDLVAGWWLDGIYFADEMYRFADPPNFQSFADALRAGNPQRIVAFNPGWVEHNPGRKMISLTAHEDYTAGEVDSMFPACKGRWVKSPDGGAAQWHVLAYAGQYWGRGEPRFPDEFLVGYTRHANEHEGVVTWDVPVSKTGEIPEAFVRQLQRLADGGSGRRTR